MKKIFLFLLLCSLFVDPLRSQSMLSSNAYVLKQGDFRITKIESEKSNGRTDLNVFIYFKQSRTKMLPYPLLSCVTNSKGDTLGTGYTEYFAHKGQDTVVYHLKLAKDEVPDYEECIFCFSGSASDREKGTVCKLTFNRERSVVAPVPVPLNCSQLKITSVKIYDPKVILPELEVSVYLDSDPDKMLQAPYIKCVKDASGKTIADGYKSHMEFDRQQGKDTLIYHLYFRNAKIPDLSGCSYYFCSPGKLSGKDSSCILNYNTASSGQKTAAKEKKFKCTDLRITKVEIDSSKGNFVLNISVQLKAPKNTVLFYPCMNAVTSAKGDTLTKMPFSYFNQPANTTMVYHLLMNKRTVPDLSACRFYFKANNLEENCALIYSRPKKTKPK